MKNNQILKQVEELPTLVDKLRFVEETFPIEGDALEKAFQEALTLSLKRQFPLFAEQIKPSEPKELSGAEDYIAIAYQILHVNKYSDIIIEQYSQNPIISKALQGDSLPKIFNGDRKKWTDNKNKYTELVGDEKPKKSPKLRVSRVVELLFSRIGVDPDLSRRKFTKKELNHPIAYLHKKLSQYNRRQENTKYRHTKYH